jgi:hypothetical protein
MNSREGVGSKRARPLLFQASGALSDDQFIRMISERIADGDFKRRFDRLEHLGWCTNPVRLFGEIAVVDRKTGELRTAHETRSGLDRILCVPCRSRLASRCEPCSRIYQADIFQLVRAGLAGGKGVPEQVQNHLVVFATLTAPSFGAIHSRAVDSHGRVKHCHPRDEAPCPHGPRLDCRVRHGPDDPVLGKPLCEGCYDRRGAKTWNGAASKLWHRFITYLLREIGRQRGMTRAQVREVLRLQYVKAAELQSRGLIHFHAVIRADGPNGPDCAPPEWCSADVLVKAVQQAAKRVRVNGQRFGDQIEVHPIDGNDAHRVAAYVAKYASKGSSGDFTAAGFLGHFASKSRTYSTTMGALRAARSAHRRAEQLDPWGRPYDDDLVKIVPNLRYVGNGHTHPADEAIAAINAKHVADEAALRREARLEMQESTSGIGWFLSNDCAAWQPDADSPSVEND